MNISDEAVEAAAEAIYKEGFAHGLSMSEAERFAEAALAAVTPQLLTRITNAVINRAYEDGRASAPDETAK